MSAVNTMPKRSFKSNTNRKSNKRRKVSENQNASFPQTSKSIKYELEMENNRKKNKTFTSKLKSKMRSKQQRNEHKSFMQRQDDTNLSAHERIQELLGKSKKKKHKRSKNRNRNKNKNKKLSSLSSLRKFNNNHNNQMKHNLDGAQFRWMNQMLYNTTGHDAKQKIKNYENEFIEYHKAYNDIVENEWPESPLQKIIKSITKKLGKFNRMNKMNNNKNKKDMNKPFIIGDFGCGDAKIAKYFNTEYNKNKNVSMKVNVKSFDLIGLNDYVTECDISDVPLESESIDLAIFCLSLMGTNFHEYLMESYRVLKPRGMLKIAEVRSRFYGINKFEKFLNRCGFDVVAKELDNTHFALFHCVKSERMSCQSFPANFDAKTVLKPCAYKKR